MKKVTSIFIVDDDPVYAGALKSYLLNEIPGAVVRTFGTAESCMLHMYLRPDFLILDYYLNSEVPHAWNGIEALKKIGWRYPFTTVIILSAQPSIELAMEMIHEGAFEYIVKNENAFPNIRNNILNVVEISDEYGT